ncbi:DUF4258 domain-containing protein [Microbacterium bandirmense]|uniref:DUF4258 domain-containing protein n=1 Tax=Microbacterium bandirmense TaxID=3122050 RepID=UPI003B281E53
MRYKLKFHARQRMAQRGITDDDIVSALMDIIMQYPAEPGSVCILGNVGSRKLAIYVSGVMPPTEPLAITTVVWRDET